MFKSCVDKNNSVVTVTIIAGQINPEIVDNEQLAQDIVNEFNTLNSDGSKLNRVIIDVEEKRGGTNANIYQLKDTIFTLKSIILKHTHVGNILVCPLGNIGKIFSIFLIPVIGLESFNRITTSPENSGTFVN